MRVPRLRPFGASLGMTPLPRGAYGLSWNDILFVVDVGFVGMRSW